MKYIIPLFVLVMSVFVAGLVLADNSTNETGVVNNSINNSDPALIAYLNNSVNESDNYVPSGFKIGWEKFKMFFIVNKTLRAEKNIMFANWEVNRARALIKRGDFAGAESALENHDAIIQKLENMSDALRAANVSVGLARAIEVQNQKIVMLQSVLNSSANLTDKQKEVFEKRMGKLNDTIEHLQDVNVSKIEARLEKEADKIDKKINNSNKIAERIQSRINNRTQNNVTNHTED